MDFLLRQENRSINVGESENFLQQENAPNAYLIEVDDCFQGGSPVICFRK